MLCMYILGGGGGGVSGAIHTYINMGFEINLKTDAKKEPIPKVATYVCMYV